MAKMTLLEMTRNILSAMDSDDVTGITDNQESAQVADTLKTIYFQFITNSVIPEQKALAQLTNSTSGAKNTMKIPDTVSKFDWFRYNKIRSGDTIVAWGDVKYISPVDMIRLCNSQDNTASNVVSITDPTSSISTLYITNDAPPQFWTSFDDLYVFCDSYDAAVDSSGLRAAKSLIWAKILPTWTVADSFVPTMDENLFPLLLAEATSTCFVNLKQTANAKAEQQSKNQRVKLQNDKFRTKDSQEASTRTQSPNYGR